MQKDINYPTLPRQEPPSAPYQASRNQAPAVAPKPDLLTIWHKLREERDTLPKTSENETGNSNREKEVVAQIQKWSVEMKRRRLPQTETFKLQMKPRTEGLSEEEEERAQWEHFQDQNRKRRASWSPPNNRKLVNTERSPLNRQNSFKPQSTVMDLQMPIPMKPLFSRLPSPPSHRRKTLSQSFESIKNKIEQTNRDVALKFKDTKKSLVLQNALDRLGILRQEAHNFKQKLILTARGHVTRKDVFYLQNQLTECEQQIQKSSLGSFPISSNRLFKQGGRRLFPLRRPTSGLAV